MSTRLTNTIRETIMQKAETRAFEKKDADLREAMNQFAEDLYSHVYREFEQSMRAMPRHFFKYRGERDISVKHPDGWMYLKKCQFKTERPFAFLTYDFDLINDDHPMFGAGMEVICKMESLKQERADFLRDCRAILWSVHTVERLLEVWPEIADLVPKEEKKAVPIPFDLTIKLNERLGIVGGAA